MAAPPFVKRNPNAPNGFFACEAAGLRWLAEAEDGVRCAAVLGRDEASISLERLTAVRPDRDTAHDFGARLAHTHDAGASAFGAGPPGWTGAGFFGPMATPLPMSLTPYSSWGDFYATGRLLPMAELAGPRLGAATSNALDRVAARCRDGDFDDDDRPARLHGDLWNGNVVWTSSGAVLIDPAAAGGHRETDLAMLALFGCPHFDEVVRGYVGSHPLRPGWRDRVGLHQLFPLLAHVVLFGSDYVGPTAAAISSALAS